MSNDRQRLKGNEEEEEPFTLVTSRGKTKFNRKPTLSARSLVDPRDEVVIDEETVLK